MPTVRKLNRQVTTQAAPDVRLTAAETPESQGAGVAAARAGTWNQLSRTSAGLAGQAIQYSNAAADRARQQADEVALLEASNKLDAWELEHVYKPGTGALNVRGKASFTLPETLDDAYKQATGEIEQGLATDAQRSAFAKMKAQRGQNVSLNIRRHVAGEMQAFDAQELQATVTNAVSLASANALDPRRAGEEIAKGEDAIIKAANRNGVGPEVYEQQVQAFQTAAHSGIINNLLASGHERAAQIYYEEKKTQIAGDKRDELEKAIEAGTTAKQARTASDQIWGTLRPTSDAAPIDLEAMEDKAREMFPDDEKALKATMQNLRERKAAADASRQDRKEATAGALWGAVAKGATLAQVQQMPEYRSAPGALQTQVSEHIVDQAEQKANRAYTRQQRAQAQQGLSENAKERAGWAEMWRVSDPAVLSKMTDNQILGLMPSLGIDHVNRLMEKRRRLTSSEASIHAATIDEDLFKTTAQRAGINAYAPKDTEKADLGQLRNAVETQIDLEQRTTGKAIGRERKQQIMQAIVDEKVMLNVWGTDPERVAATVVNPADRQKAYVPIARVPPTALEQYRNYVRSVSPAAQGMSDGQITATFGSRIQRAYARRLMGGTRAEIEAIITGAED